MKKLSRKTMRILDENDELKEVDEVGTPMLFSPQRWDLEEELQDNEALREHFRELNDAI